MEFKDDSQGRPLRYKVLIRDMAVKHILYNTGNSVEFVPFEEYRFNEGDLVVISEHSMGPAGRLVGTVVNVPICMVACYGPDQERVRDSLVDGMVEHPLVTHCNRRYFEKLPGYVDITIVSDDGLESISREQMPAAVACCALESATEHHQVMLTSLHSYEKAKQVSGV